jgi:hypothetical protein
VGKYIEIGGFAPDEVPEDLKQVTRVNLAHYREQWAKGWGSTGCITARPC